MWRKSRVLYQMATAPNVDSSEKARLAEEAYKLISEALECNNNHFAVHKWMSIILDLRSSCIGTKERIKNLAIVKKHMMVT